MAPEPWQLYPMPPEQEMAIRRYIARTVATRSELSDRLRGDGPCQDCGTLDNIVWFADNPLWNHVMAKTTPGSEFPSLDDPGGIVCITCFVKRVDAAGLAPYGWRLMPEWRWTDRPRD